MTIIKEIKGGVKWTSLSAMFIAVFQILKISVLTRFLEKADFGLMALVLFVLGFMNLFMDMGLSSAILHKQEISKKEYSSLYFLNIFFSIFLYLLVLLITPLVVAFYKQQELKILLPLMAFGIIFSGIGRQFKTVLQKKLEFKTIAIVEILASSMSMIIAIVLAVKGFGVYSLVLSALFQYIVSNLVFAFIGFRRDGLHWHFSFAETRPFLKIGIYQVGSQCINYFSRDFDILIIGRVFDASVLGSYSLAKQLVMRPIQLINPIITKVAAPYLSKLQTNLDELRDKYLKLVKLVATVNMPIYLIIIVFAPLIIRVLYGQGYENIIFIVRFLSISMYLRSVSNPIGSLIVALGRTDIDFFWGIFTLIIIPVTVLIGSFFGVNGIAISMATISFLLLLPLWLFVVKRLIGVSIGEYFFAMLPYLNLKKIKEWK